MEKNLIISDYKQISLWILLIGFVSTICFWVFNEGFFVYLSLFVFLVLLINAVIFLLRFLMDNFSLKDKIYFSIFVISSISIYCVYFIIDYKIFCNSMTE